MTTKTRTSTRKTQAEVPMDDEALLEGTDPESIAIGRDQKSSIRIFVVDDDRSLSSTCVNLLEDEGYDVSTEDRGDAALETLRSRRFDIVLVDLYMRQVSGLDLLKATLKANPETIVIVITGKPSIDTSLEALRRGAWDYLPKPFSATHLQVLIGRAAHTVVVARESAQLKGALDARHGHSEKITLLGRSPAFRGIVDVARRVAATDASVFVMGESGTGKEVIAQFIHHHSRRSSRRMVAVNCAALPEPLLESEMFGHVEGAFTGAVRDKPGLLEEANGGTLFLDELTEMPPSVQAKLLRVIQDGVVRRVGSTDTDSVVNVRFIAATNRDPEVAIKDEALREDLYYRLRVVPIRIPPLRERPEDIPILAQHFFQEAWAKHREGEKAPRLTEAAVFSLQSRPWRGNVRELQNVIEHAVVLLDPGKDVQPEDVPRFDDDESPAPFGAGFHQVSTSMLQTEYHRARDRVLARFERTYLEWVVNEADGNMSEAARIASVDRTTLYRLMEKHELTRGHLREEEAEVQ